MPWFIYVSNQKLGPFPSREIAKQFAFGLTYGVAPKLSRTGKLAPITGELKVEIKEEPENAAKEENTGEKA